MCRMRRELIAQDKCSGGKMNQALEQSHNEKLDKVRRAPMILIFYNKSIIIVVKQYTEA